MNKRQLALFLAAALTVTTGLTGCGSKTDTADDTAAASESTETGIANPNLYDVGYEEAAKIIDLPAPEGAENVTWDIIGYEDENPIVEMRFDLDGVTYYERAQMTSHLSLSEAASDSEDAEGAIADTMNIQDTDFNISGLYGEFDRGATTLVRERDAIACGSDDGSFVVWLDVVPGILYNLATTDKVDLSVLEDTANAVFVCVQGDSDGDEAAANVLSPLPASVSMENLTDCTLNVSFTADDFDFDRNSLDVSVYDVLCYDAVDVNNLQVGDSVETGDGTVEVKTMTDSDAGIVINDGEDDFLILQPQESGGIYQIVGEDDEREMALLGQAELTLADDVILHDCTTEPGETVEVSASELKDHVEGSVEIFDEDTTTVTLDENGIVTEITHSWRP